MNNISPKALLQLVDMLLLWVYTQYQYFKEIAMSTQKFFAEWKDIEPKPYKCRCGYEWFPRRPGDHPRVCPKCKSPNWDRPYKFRRAAK